MKAIIFIFCLVTVLSSCKKEKVTPTPSQTTTVTTNSAVESDYVHKLIDIKWWCDSVNNTSHTQSSLTSFNVVYMNLTHQNSIWGGDIYTFADPSYTPASTGYKFTFDYPTKKFHYQAEDFLVISLTDTSMVLKQVSNSYIIKYKNKGTY